jgi:tetratricopeptide (TPR) repeat protein
VTRTQWLLLGVIAAEVALGAFLLVRHLNQPTPPIPDWNAVDPVATGELRSRVTSCQTGPHWQKLGELYLASGYFPEAEACLRQAARLTPGNAGLAFRQAFALERLGQAREAIAAYTQAIERGHSRKADCWYYVGRNHLRLGETDAARAAFQRAGDLPGAEYERALLDAEEGHPAEAQATAKRLAEAYPEAYPPVGLLYRLARRRGDDREASLLAESFTRRPRPLPTPFDHEVDWVFDLANRLGRNRLLQEARREAEAGRLPTAEKLLRTALEAGWTPEVADKLAGVLLAQGQRAEGLDLLVGATARGRASPELLWRLGQAQGEAGQPQRALETWERASRMATGPAASDLLQDLADRTNPSGRGDQGRRLTARARLARAVGLLDAGRPREALAEASGATEADPNLAEAWFNLGEALRQVGQPVEARRAYEHCLQRNPDHGRALRYRRDVE